MVLAGRVVLYRLRRRARASIGLRVDATGLSVHAPLRTPLRDIEAVLHRKSRWVLAKLALHVDAAPPPVAWVDGARLPYLGGGLTLALASGPTAAVRRGEVLAVRLSPHAQAPDAVRAAVTAWYRREASALFAARLAHYCAPSGRPVPPLRLSNALTRWGSCSATGVIRLNWRLLKAPLAEIDYVVAHELAHLEEMNHSPRFWAALGRLFPDYAGARVDLKRHGALYRRF